jgi:membrane fusion protein, peptide pheromone/bacteriocin exporter
MNDLTIKEYDPLKGGEYHYLRTLSVRSGTMYTFLILLVIAAFMALPFIHVQVSSTAPTSIESIHLKEVVSSPMPGRITRLNIVNNGTVSKGDTLLSVDHTSNQTELNSADEKIDILNDNIRDITIIETAISAPTTPGAPPLHTSRYAADYQAFIQQKKQLDSRIANAVRTDSRNQYLYKEKVISASEFDQSELALQQAKSDEDILIKRLQSQVQADKYNYQAELLGLKTKQRQLKESIKVSDVVANISGTAYISEGLQPGSFVEGGQKLAEITPDTGLIAECFVSPKDIGFVKSGQDVQLKIDAYNFYDWGMMHARVVEIFKDVTLVDNHPYYVVHCKMEKSYLTMKNGFVGTIIKGMTGQAYFVLNRKSLWQLLFAKVNDWLNPKSN